MKLSIKNIESNLESRLSLIKALDADIEKARKRISEILEEVADYEEALKKLRS